MSTPSWPDYLPSIPLRDGLSEVPNKRTIGFAVESGPGKKRRRSTARTATLSPTIPMTAAEVALFEAWYEDTVLDGALAFTFRDPLTAATATFRFDPDAEADYEIKPRAEPGERDVVLRLQRLP